MTSFSPAFTHRLSLQVIDLYDSDQYSRLKQQREICGWASADSDLRKWRGFQEKGLKSFFWIIIPETDTGTASSGSEGKDAVYAGHVSLDAYADPPDLELANPDKSVLTIQNFFLLPQYRSRGLGRAVMDMMESIAKKEPYGSPNCKWVTVTALNKKYFEQEGPEWRGLFERCGLQLPERANQVWYERRGYVKWKEELRFDEPLPGGGTVRVSASFLRKAVASGLETQG